MLEKTSLDRWVAEKIGLQDEDSLTPRKILAYQDVMLKKLLAYVSVKSPFYRELYRNVDTSVISGLDDLSRLPMVDAGDLVEHSSRMVCVSQKEISRIVTLETTGTTGSPKRVYFTNEDQELTIDFFHRGMLNLIGPSDHLLILLPWERPGSVGDLLQKGVRRIGAEVTCYGLVDSPESVVNTIIARGITSLVGVPVQILSLVYAPGAEKVNLAAVLLSTDYVAGSLAGKIGLRFGCPVFEHYGMTETGLGGAVSCRAFQGYHPRAADLVFEIIDPNSGELLETGETGEIVVTTLTRQGMPFIRYRTGDKGRFLAKPCPCGSVLPRLDKVKGRYSEDVTMGGQTVNLANLDELLFALDGVIDYQAEVKNNKGKEWIKVNLLVADNIFNIPEHLSYDGIDIYIDCEIITLNEAPVYRKRKFVNTN